MTAVLRFLGRVWTAFCRPVRSRALGSPPAGPYGGPGPLGTLIRERSYATYHRSRNEIRVDDPFIIDSGNRRAHVGDVNLDVHLFKNRLIAWEDTFEALYGISWVQAEKLLGMLVYSPTHF